MSARVINADMLTALPALAADGVRFDSCVTDPPYHLLSIVKRFGGAKAKAPTARNYASISRGFMGHTWDGGDIAFRPETWAAVGAVMRPGAHLAAFGGTRGWHRIACAIEDAGFEIRDTLAWIYGTGFPKSHKLADGVGTALKPAFEPIILARWPCDGTARGNFLKYGTGGLNVEACRIETDGPRMMATKLIGQPDLPGQRLYGAGLSPGCSGGELTALGRWPANVLHDGSAEVLDAFPRSESTAALRADRDDIRGGNWGRSERPRLIGPETLQGYSDSGSAARFFYCAKAGRAERNGSKHPTVKPLSLMQWLTRLVTPPRGLVLDPFGGSGTTAQACLLNGLGCVAIEREAEYAADIQRRIDHVHGADTPLFMAAAE